MERTQTRDELSDYVNIVDEENLTDTEKDTIIKLVFRLFKKEED